MVACRRRRVLERDRTVVRVVDAAGAAVGVRAAQSAAGAERAQTLAKLASKDAVDDEVDRRVGGHD